MRFLPMSILLTVFLATPGFAQEIPANAHQVSWGQGWECNRGYVERDDRCISLGRATDQEIRRYLIEQSIRSYSGNCPCPYNQDSAGRRCGGRSAYSRPGGASPLCYPGDISDRRVERIRNRYASEDTTFTSPLELSQENPNWCPVGFVPASKLTAVGKWNG